MNYRRLAEAVCFDLEQAGIYASESITMYEEANKWAWDARSKVHVLALLTDTDNAWALVDALDVYCGMLARAGE